jgi:RNA polymerase sigma-70 factor (ECF subfamily)
MPDVGDLPYIDGLYGYAMAITRNPAEAEDLVQETYVRAIPAVRSLPPESNLKSWLFTILRNVWLNQLRRRRSAPGIVEIDQDGRSANIAGDASKDPYTLYMTRTERDRVRGAIQQLPLEFREIIILREYEELSYQEIASRLDCPPGTVMSRLARARARLRILLTAESQPLIEGERSD